MNREGIGKELCVLYEWMDRMNGLALDFRRGYSRGNDRDL